MDQKELNAILEKHKKWLRGEEGGERADLRGADLRGALMQGALLQGAVLQGAVLRGADMRGACLQEAALQRANLQGAKLKWAKLGVAEDVPFIPMACPETGAFVGWKKCRGDLIVKLLIPEDARRSSATGRKCRCDKATVLDIETPDGMPAGTDTARSQRRADFLYKVGEMVAVDGFDENRFNECAPGIHFFINRQEAVDYDG